MNANKTVTILYERLSRENSRQDESLSIENRRFWGSTLCRTVLHYQAAKHRRKWAKMALIDYIHHGDYLLPNIILTEPVTRYGAMRRVCHGMGLNIESTINKGTTVSYCNTEGGPHK